MEVKVEAFKRRIQAMCDQIELVHKIPNMRPTHTLYISEDQVGLGDCTMKVTTEEMNEIFRFIIKERYV